MLQNLFALPIWKVPLKIDSKIEFNLLSQIENNYLINKNYIKEEWSCIVHSTIDKYNNINYDSVIPYYEKEYKKFASKSGLNLNYHNYYIFDVWYNYYKKYSNQETHNHTHLYLEQNQFTFFSAVHFLKISDNHPTITFYNPVGVSPSYGISEKVQTYFKDEINHSFMFRNFSLKVRQGDFIIFPSFLEHAVFQQKIDDPRITIALNIRSDWS
jgi:hypothetical protein